MRSQVLQLRFPTGGVVKRLGLQTQAPYTTPSAINVWPDDPIEDRERGGTRPGLARYRNSAPGSGSINLLADVAYVSGGSTAIRRLMGRGGSLYYDDGTNWTSVDTGLSTAAQLTAADLLQKLYISNPSGSIGVYSPSSNTLTGLTASDGTAPTNVSLTAAWNNRLVAVSTGDQQNWYMSKLGDPLNWNYAPTDVTTLDAVAGNNSDQGRVGDNITALIPHTHECLIFGCATSLWVMQGDPLSGGRLVRLSDHTGIIDKNAWCYDPDGYLYFMSYDGLYVMAPGCGSAPRSISRERIPKELLQLDPATYRISLSYDLRFRGILLTAITTGSSGNISYWIDTRSTIGGDTGGLNCSFWTCSITNNYLPYVTKSLRAYSSSSATLGNVLVAGKDGYIRQFSTAATDDDTVGITSRIQYGPFPLAGPGTEGLLQEIQLALAVGSGAVSIQLATGKTAEEAHASLASGITQSFSTAGGLNRSWRPRLRGQFATLYVASISASRWVIEDMQLTRLPLGRRRV